MSFKKSEENQNENWEITYNLFFSSWTKFVYVHLLFLTFKKLKYGGPDFPDRAFRNNVCRDFCF